MRKKRMQSRYRDLISTYCRIAGVSWVDIFLPNPLVALRGQRTETDRQPAVRLRKGPGEGPRRQGGGHEIGVPAPARNEVDVEVVGDPRPGDLAQIHPHVQPLGGVLLREGLRPQRDEGDELSQFLPRQEGQVVAVTARGAT